jgi:hypothetical protein
VPTWVAAVIEDCFSEVGEEVETIMLWRAGCMVIRRQGVTHDEAGEPTTYLGLATVAPVEAGHERPTIVGSTAVPQVARLPASSPWARDPCGDEGPLGYSIEDLPAVGGAGGSHGGPIGAGVEISAPVSGRAEDDASAGQ